MTRLRIGLLHLKPLPGQFEFNCDLVERGMAAAAARGADWVVTPELCLSGYLFEESLGAGWIGGAADRWRDRLTAVAARRGVTLFFSHPERDPATGLCHNTVFVLGADGRVLGAHRKINVVRPAEGWATPGTEATPVSVGPHSVGILVCADAYTSGTAAALRRQGARMLISPAAWPPEPHGPEGAWEARSRETGLPLFVCNRTGDDFGGFNLTRAQSVAAHRGELRMALEAADSTLIMLHWDLGQGELLEHSAHPRATWSVDPAPAASGGGRRS